MVVHETRRLFLKTWALADFDEFALIARDPQVMRYIAEGHTWPDSRIGWFMGTQSALQETLGYCNWKLTDRETGELVGITGLAPLQSIGEIEIGWWLKPEYWKQGLAFEAAECAVKAAFEEHDIPRIIARAYQSNVASLTLMGRLGMVFDRIIDNNSLGDVVLYTLEKPGTHD